MRVFKETWELIKEFDPENAKWYPLIALEFIGYVGIWCYMAMTCGPVL